MRIAAAIAVIAVTFSAAVVLHQRRVTPVKSFCSVEPASGPLYSHAACLANAGTWYSEQYGAPARPSWADPAALILVIVGVGGAAGTLLLRRRRTA